MSEVKTPAKRIPLPEPAARIYQAVTDLDALYPGRKFTPDGHMVGSIGEVIAAEALGLHPVGRRIPGVKTWARRRRRERRASAD